MGENVSPKIPTTYAYQYRIKEKKKEAFLSLLKKEET